MSKPRDSYKNEDGGSNEVATPNRDGITSTAPQRGAPGQSLHDMQRALEVRFTRDPARDFFGSIAYEERSYSN